jgi:hypothetical protein
VKNLKTVCSALGQPIGGTKGVLQQRLRSYFDQLVTKGDTARFNIGKNASEAERGMPYGAARYDCSAVDYANCSRPNLAHPSGPSTATPSQTNTWGMSPVYQNVRLRMDL